MELFAVQGDGGGREGIRLPQALLLLTQRLKGSTAGTV